MANEEPGEPVDVMTLFQTEPFTGEELAAAGYVREYDFSKGAAEFERFARRNADDAARQKVVDIATRRPTED